MTSKSPDTVEIFAASAQKAAESVPLAPEERRFVVDKFLAGFVPHNGDWLPLDEIRRLERRQMWRSRVIFMELTILLIGFAAFNAVVALVINLLAG